ncbi:MAG: gliding motility-associated C-terminal domain-containing protein [Bacteroidota bacterium]
MLKTRLHQLLVVGLLLFVSASVSPLFAQPTISCPAVNAGNDTILTGPGCANLTAVPVAGAQPTTYNVTPIPYNPYPYNAGTPILLNIDDTYSGALPIGFDFCFYGFNYNQCLIGSNGILSFDLGLAGGFCPWAINNPIPSALNPTNCIMAPWQDIDPSAGGAIRWASYGVAPCRTFVVSYDVVPMFSFGCGGQLYTAQIVLYETTNIIETYIQNKTICAAWNGGNAIHGVTDATTTQATVVPGRNFPTQWAAMNDAWRFVPAGPPNFGITWYEVGNPIPIANTATVNVCPATCQADYYAEVTYTNCNNATVVVTDTVNVAIQQQINPNAVLTNVSCNGANDGSIATAPSGGSAPYNYLWTPGGATTAGITGLGPGNYTLQITDNLGCDTTLTFTIAEPPAITATPAVVNVTCNGAADGSITLNGVGGGTAPYQYSLNGGPFQTANAFTGLAGGTYSVTVRDANNCTVTLTNISVTEPAAFTATPAVVPTSCNGSTDGSITINGVTGGTAPYQYSLNGGPFQAGNSFPGLGGGTYSVTVRDANNCTVTLTNLTVGEPPAITGTPAITPASCNGGNGGSIAINGVAGGTPPYQYSLNGGPFQAGNSFPGLAAGTYTVTVRDANNCTLLLPNLVVAEPPALTATTNLTNVSCNGASDGQIDAVNAAGGTPPYQYSLNGGPFQAGNSFPGLGPGTYSLTVRDANNCTLLLNNLLLTEPSAITANDSTVTATCLPGMDGEIWILNASGGTGPYQYSLNGGPFQAANNFTGLNSGAYTVVVRDANGCTLNLAPAVPSPGNVAGNVAATNVVCNGGNNGQLSVNATSGTAPFQYSVNGGPFQASGNFGGLTAGSYNVTIRDNFGCTTTLVVAVGEPAAISAAPVVVDATCNGANDGSINLTNAAGGTAPYQYSLNGGPFQPGPLFGSLVAGPYSVTIRDANNCTVTLTGILVNEPAALTATPNLTAVSCNGGTDGQIDVLNVTGGTPPYQFSLNGGAFQAGNSFPGLAAGTYSVTVRDANNCTLVLNSLVLNAPAPIVANDSTVTASCVPGMDGEIWILNAVGGTPPYQYNLNGGPFQAANSFTGLNPGPYTAVVQDANGCTFNLQPAVPAPGNVTATATPTDASCNGLTDGQISVTVTAGSVPFAYSLNGGPFQTGNSFTGLGAANYNVTVRDALGCTVVLPVTIGEPVALSATLMSTDVSCNAAADGAISLNNPAGGTLPYQYSLNGGPFQAGTAFPGLSGGAYTVTIRDANNCTATLGPVVVNEPALLMANVLLTNISCNGGSDGQIDVNNATGGTPPYQYSLNGGPFQASTSFPGLNAGTYAVVVRDANNCTATYNNLSLTEPSALSASDSTVTATCTPGMDGEIWLLNAMGGTPPYQYNLNGGPFQAANSFTGLSGGAYTVVVQDGNGCSFTLSPLVPFPGNVTAVDSVVPVTCPGGSDGEIWVNALTANPPLQYSLNGGPFQAGNSFTGLAAGTYPVEVRDGLGCTVALSANVTEPAPITAVPLPTNVSCNGAGDGMLDIQNVTGGTPPYQYSLNGGPFQAGNSFPGLLPGSYAVVIQDGNGCLATLSGQTITEPTPLAATDSTVTATCTPGMDGEIWILNAGGGTPPYQYNLNGGPFQPASSFLNLNGGNYTVTVQDGNGCTFNLGVTVPSPANITATDSTLGVTCSGSTDGEIWIVNVVGNAPFQYRLNGGPFQTGTSFTGLAAGTYTVEVRDSLGCTVSWSVTVPAPAPITAGDSTVDIRCNGGADGELYILNVSGGTPPYQYSLNGGPFQAGNGFTGLAVGNYSYAVRDSNGCLLNAGPVAINEPAPLALTGMAVAASCNGGSDGAWNLTGVSGGTAPYVFSLDSLTWIGATGFSGLAAGNYTVYVRDFNGCVATLPITIGEASALVLGTSTMPATCGNADGSASVTVSGGTAPYSYAWSSGAISPIANGLTGGGYTVVITDANGCQDSAAVTIPELGAPTVNIVASGDPSCNDRADGFAVAVASGGSGNYALQWNLPVPVSTDSLNGVPAGTYTVIVTDSNGCSDTAAVVLNDPPALELDSAGGSPTCVGDQDGTAEVFASGGTPGYTYRWSDGQTTGAAINLGAGSYAVTVTDQNGCADSLTVDLLDPPLVVAAFTSNPLLPAQLELEDASVSLTNQSLNASNYTWQFGDGNGSTLTDPLHTYLNPGDYCVTLVAVDRAGCADTVETCNYLVVLTEFIIPNTFTPNEDGHNDQFEIVGISQFPNNKLMVFNRWGNLIYEKEQYDNTWEGRNWKSGDPLPDGAYFYIFTTGETNADTGEPEEYMGDIVIFR